MRVIFGPRFFPSICFLLTAAGHRPRSPRWEAGTHIRVASWSPIKLVGSGRARRDLPWHPMYVGRFNSAHHLKLSGLGSVEFLQVLFLGDFRGKISVCGSFALLSASILWSDNPWSEERFFFFYSEDDLSHLGVNSPPTAPPVDALWLSSWWCFSAILQHKQVCSAELSSANVSQQKGGGTVGVDEIWVLSRSLRFHVSAPHTLQLLNTDSTSNSQTDSLCVCVAGCYSDHTPITSRLSILV